MAHTYEELKHKTVVELREIAKGIEHEAVKGFTQLNKEHLLPAICKALGIDMHAHHAAAKSAAKAEAKARIRALKAERDKALAAHDGKQLAAVRRQMRGLKRRIKKASA
jgi:hypothetical protein